MPLDKQTGVWYADHRDPTVHRPPLLMIHGAGGTHLDWPAELHTFSLRLLQVVIIHISHLSLQQPKYNLLCALAPDG